jgi:hypothetical protein
MQLMRDHWAAQAQEAFARQDFDRAKQLGEIAQRYNLEAIKYQNDLANQVSWKDVLGFGAGVVGSGVSALAGGMGYGLFNSPTAPKK